MIALSPRCAGLKTRMRSCDTCNQTSRSLHSTAINTHKGKTSNQEQVSQQKHAPFSKAENNWHKTSLATVHSTNFSQSAATDANSTRRVRFDTRGSQRAVFSVGSLHGAFRAHGARSNTRRNKFVEKKTKVKFIHQRTKKTHSSLMTLDLTLISSCSGMIKME